MSTRILSLILLFALNKMFAEGPPIDTSGHIRCKYISITLDSLQIEHLQKSRWLDLTLDQRKQLPFLLPKTIDIVDPFFNSCTCGMIYGMWYAKDKIAFCVSEAELKQPLNIEGKTDTSSVDESVALYNDYPKIYGKNFIYIGLSGELFHEGKSITIEELNKIAKKIKEENIKDASCLVFCLPPTKENLNYKKVFITKRDITVNLPSNLCYAWN